MTAPYRTPDPAAECAALRAEVAPADLRARCPTCHSAVAVRRQGAAWRMAPHKRWDGTGWTSHEVTCPVRGVDALPAIAAWFDHEARDQNWREAHATQQRAKAVEAIASADATLDAVRVRRETLAALRALVPAEGARS